MNEISGTDAGQPTASGSGGVALAAAVITIAAVVAYHNTLSAPFVFDDAGVVANNPAIRHLWPIWEALSPPANGSPVTGRPLVNLSLALNYAMGGVNVWSYHALNLLIHVLAGLTLFGVLRRTLLLPSLREKFAPLAVPLAGVSALLWTIHPLQTESVTYVGQRAEELVGLFYLLTLYGFIRGVEADIAVTTDYQPLRTNWLVLSLIACAAGMASKEVMVSAPLIVLLFDRTFVSGSMSEAFRRHGRVHGCMAATWLLLLMLVIGSGNRGGSAGFGAGVASTDYALTQAQAIVLYLQLAVWPHPLVFDYGNGLVKFFVDVAPQVGFILLLVAATVVALWRKPVLGFFGAWFLFILAPSSSVVPVVTQTMAEHRMYLSLIALIVPAVMGVHLLVGRRAFAAWAVLGLAFVFATTLRNDDYRSEIALWRDTADKRPTNSRAHYNLANALMLAQRAPEALVQFEQVARLDPSNAEAHLNAGALLAESGRLPEAMGHFEQAVKLKPDDADTHLNLANVLLESHRVSEAIVEYEKALRLNPTLPDARENLAVARQQLQPMFRRP